MKIRFVIAAAMLAAAAACSTTPTTVDAPRDTGGISIHHDSPPIPPDTLNRGGGGLGSGS